MTWDYWSFPCHKFAPERFKTRGRNTILYHYHYRVDPDIGRGVFAICLTSCAFLACVSQLDEYWLPNCAPSYQPRYVRIQNWYSKTILEHYNDWIIME